MGHQNGTAATRSQTDDPHCRTNHTKLQKQKGTSIMARPNSSNPAAAKRKNRRSGLDRRWIIAPHKGAERRSGRDRRGTLVKRETTTISQVYGPSELALFKDLLMANSIQIDAVAQLLIEKGVFSKEEFFDMLQQVQAEYEKKAEIEA